MMIMIAVWTLLHGTCIRVLESGLLTCNPANMACEALPQIKAMT